MNFYKLIILPLVFVWACSVQVARIVELSPDGKKTLVIAHVGEWGCGSDGCLVITILDGSRKEILRTRGFHPRFAAAAWSEDSREVSVVVGNLYGPESIAFTLEVATGQKLDFNPGLVRIEAQVRIRHRIDVHGRLLEWSKSEEANQVYRSSLAK